MGSVWSAGGVRPSKPSDSTEFGGGSTGRAPATSRRLRVRIPPTRFSRLLLGAVAQLEERLDGIEEVAGSIPVCSTHWGGPVRCTRARRFPTHPGRPVRRPALVPAALAAAEAGCGFWARSGPGWWPSRTHRDAAAFPMGFDLAGAATRVSVTLVP